MTREDKSGTFRPMGKLQLDFETAFQRAQRQVILEQALRHPELTLGELGELAKSQGVEDLSIGELLSRKQGNGVAPSGGETKRQDRDNGVSEGAVDTRSAKGREGYDQSILDVLGEAEKEMSASELRAKVGGTPLQARTALNRLIEAEKVTWQGRARSTRYKIC